MKQFTKIVDLLVFGNIYIGVCSVALVFTTYLLNGIPLHFSPAVWLVFFATWFYYNFHHHSHHLDFGTFSKFIESVKLRNMNFREIIFLLIPAIGILISLIWMNLAILIVFASLSIVSILYSIPLVKWNGRRRKIRESLLLKLPFLALTWAAATVLIPLLENEYVIDNRQILAQAFARALFIYGLCIPFEIRDADSEKKWGTNTLPVVYGLRITRITGILILVFGVVLRHVARDYLMLSPAVIFALDLSFFVAMGWIVIVKLNPPKYFCKVFVDGTMILQFVFVYLAIQSA